MKFKEGEINWSTKNYIIKATQNEITFGDKLKIEKVVFTFEWQEAMSSAMKVSIDGIVKVTDRKYVINAVKEENSKYFGITKFEGDMVLDMISFVKGIDPSLSETSLGGEHDGINFDKFKTGLSWSESLKATGNIDCDNGSFQLIFFTTAEVNHLSAFGGNGAKMRVILTRKSKSTSLSLVAVFGEETTLGPVFDSFLDKNPDDLLLQRIKDKKFSIILTQKNVNIDVVPSLQEEYDKLFQQTFPTEVNEEKEHLELKSGVSVNIELDVKADINRCIELMKEQGVVRGPLTTFFPTVTLSGQFKATGIQFSYPEDSKIPMKEFLMCATENPDFIDIPQNLFDEDINKEFYVYDYFKSATIKTITLRFKPSEPITLKKFRMKVKTLDFGLVVTAKTSKNQDKIQSNQQNHKRTGGGQTQGTPKKKKQDKNYVLSVTAELLGEHDKKTRTLACSTESFKTFECTIYVASLQLKDAMRQTFQLDENKESIINDILENEMLQAFFSSGVKDLTFKFSMGKSTRLGVTGNLVIAGFEGLHFEVIYYPGAGFAIGVAVNEIPLEEIINFFLSAFNVKISVPWLDKLNGAFIYSTIDLEKIKALEKEDSSTESRSKRSIEDTFGENLQSIAYETQSNFLNDTHLRSTPVNIKDYMQQKMYKRTKSTSKNPSSNEETKKEDKNDEKKKEEKKLFSIASLREFEIDEGVKMKLEWQIPAKEECKDSSICKFLACKLAGSKLTLKAEFRRRPLKFSLSAELETDIDITDKLSFTGAALEISYGTALSDKFIQLRATLHYVGPKDVLDFQGSIKGTAAGELELEFTMKGFINSPLGIPNFRVGNILLGVTLDIKKLSFKFEFGAQIEFGKLEPFQGDAVITLEGYVGLDPFKLANSWIYAKSSALTLGVLCRMFDVKNIPSRFEDEGFVDGITFSYSLTAEKEIECLGKTIPQGIHIAGGLKYLWMRSSGELTLDFKEKKFEIKVRISPIEWLDGLIKVTRMDDETKGPTKGPFLNINYAPNEPLVFKIDGKISMFAFSAGVKISIDDQKIHFAVFGAVIPGFLAGTITVDSILGSGRFPTFSITVGVELDNFARKLLEYMTNYLKLIKEVAIKVKEKAEELKDAAKQLEQTVGAKLNEWKGSVSSWKEKLEKRKKELEKERASQTQYTDCVEDCKDIWIGFLEWKSNCWKVWGHWIGCPHWNPNKWQVKNIFCLGKCELQFLATAFMEWVNETINKIKIAISQVALYFLDVVDKIKTAIGDLVQTSLDLFTDITNAVIKFIDLAVGVLSFDLHHFELKATMGRGFQHCFSFALKISFKKLGFEKEVFHDQTQICLNQILLSLLKMIFGSNDKLTSVVDFDNKRDEFEGRVMATEKEEQNVERESQKTGDEVESEMAKVNVDDVTQRDKLPGDDTFQFIDETKTKYNFTNQQRDFLNKPHHMNTYYEIPDHMLHAFDEKSAWVVAENHLDEPRDYIPVPQENSDERVRRSIGQDEENSPCDRMKRTIHSYREITNGLMKSSNNMQYGKQQMNIEHREHISKLHDLHQETHKLGSKYKNYTPKQKRDIYFWYSNIKKGCDHHRRLHKRNTIQHDHETIATYRSHLNTIISKNKNNSTFHDHIDEMHENAIEGYRKSNVKRADDGEKLLYGIKEDLKEVLTRKDLPLSRMKRRLNKLNENIRKMNEHVIRCQ